MISAQFDEVVQGETILPSQWRDRMRAAARSPEQTLLAELLIDAIQCYQLVGSITHHYDQCSDTKRFRLHLEAERWIFDDNTALVTFMDVCQALDIEPGWIRKALLAWKESGRGPIRIERAVRHSKGAHPTAVRDYYRRKKDSVNA